MADSWTEDSDLGIERISRAREIGRGGSATVWEAYDQEFDRSVAVKVLSIVDRDACRRFDREIRIMGRLSTHPHVITPYSAGYTVAGNPYVIMELVDGGSLQDLLVRLGPIPWPQAIDYVLPICDALDHAHRRHVAHRDVKPANILLSGGVPLLSDFGIAAVMNGVDTTQVALSLYYSPPEAFTGTMDDRDERSDIYSVAATLYALVNGTPAFYVDHSDTPAAFMRRIEQLPVAKLDPDVTPPELDDLLRWAMAKRPADRPARIGVLADELKSIRATVGAPPLPLPPRRRASDRAGFAVEWATAPEEEGATRPGSPSGPNGLVGGAGVASTESAGRSSRPRPRSRLFGWVMAALLAITISALGLLLLGTGQDEPEAAVVTTLPPVETTTAPAGVASTQPPAAASSAVAEASTEQVGSTVAKQPAVIVPKVYNHGNVVWDVDVLPDGRLVSSDDSSARVWDPDDLTVDPLVFLDHQGQVQRLAVLDDGRVASGSNNGQIYVWDPDSLSELPLSFSEHSILIQDLIALDDGRMVSAGLTEAVRIWNPDDPGIETVSITSALPDVWSLLLLTDGRVASGGGDDVIRIWDPASPTGAQLVLSGHDSVVFALAQLPDGRLVSASLDSTVRVWDLSEPTADPVVYRRHTSPLQAVVALPDGRVASAGSGQTIWVWDPDAVEAEGLALLGHSGAISSLAVLDDGRLVSGSADGTVRLWDLAIAPRANDK